MHFPATSSPKNTGKARRGQAKANLAFREESSREYYNARQWGGGGATDDSATFSIFIRSVTARRVIRD